MDTTSLIDRIKGLKLVAFDFDGVFTDGRVMVHQDGSESVICSRKDTLRLSDLQKAGLKLVVISKEKNPVVSARCQKMGVECFQGVDTKIALFKGLLEREDVGLSQAAFVGDDINDLECLEHAGVAFTVADGHPSCRSVADFVAPRGGGQGGVRDICDLILETLGL